MSNFLLLWFWFCFFVFCFFSETGSYYSRWALNLWCAWGNLELLVLPPLLSKSWGYKCVPLYLGGEYLFLFSNLIILNVGKAEWRLEFLYIADKDANSNQPGKCFVGFIHRESAVPFLGLYGHIECLQEVCEWSSQTGKNPGIINDWMENWVHLHQRMLRGDRKGTIQWVILQSVGPSEKRQKQRASKCLVPRTCNSRKGKAMEWKSMTPRAGEGDKDGAQNARASFVGWRKCLYRGCRSDYTATPISFHLRPQVCWTNLSWHPIKLQRVVRARMPSFPSCWEPPQLFSEHSLGTASATTLWPCARLYSSVPGLCISFCILLQGPTFSVAVTSSAPPYSNRSSISHCLLELGAFGDYSDIL